MALDIPTGTPQKFVQGDTVKWYINEADCPAATWTLTYHFVGLDEDKAVTAVDNGDNRWLVTIAATASADYPDGELHYAAKISNAGEVSTIERGVITVERDYAAATPGEDQRTHNEKMLQAIRAVMENKASRDQQSMSIGGRSLTRYTWAELQSLERDYALRVSRDRANARGVDSSKVRARFVA